MAITFVGEGAAGWAAGAGGTTAGPNEHASTAVGDRVFMISVWKPFSITATCRDNSTAAAWTEIDESADGSVGVGNGTGSVKVGVWYFDWNGTDINGEVLFSTAVDIQMTSILTFRKDASDTWDTPTFTNGNQSGSTISVTGASNLNYAAGDLMLAILGIRDDGTFTSFSADATGISWASAFNQAPATNGSTTLGNDISAAAGYRIASSGTSSAAPTMSGTLGATETGRGTFIRQSVTTTAAERVPFYRPHIPLLPH